MRNEKNRNFQLEIRRSKTITNRASMRGTSKSTASYYEEKSNLQMVSDTHMIDPTLRAHTSAGTTSTTPEAESIVKLEQEHIQCHSESSHSKSFVIG
jgi:hypothetical protein